MQLIRRRTVIAAAASAAAAALALQTAPANAAPSAPTVSDNFNGRTALGSNWGTPASASAPLAPTVSGGLLRTTAAGGWTSAYWTTAFGANQEAYVTKRSAAPVGVGACLRHPGSGTQEGYSLELSASGVPWLWKYKNGVATAIYQNFTALGPVAVGDRFGLKVTGTAVESWRQQPGGAWQLLRSDTDADAGACAGYLTVTGGGGDLDDFGGTGAALAPPFVSISSPNVVSGVWSGTQTITTTVGPSTVGVQFKVDGQNIGPEDTTPPFSAAWNTALPINGKTSTGAHTVTAVARNLAGQTSTATAGVAVRNGTLMAMHGGKDEAPSDWDATERLGYGVERMEILMTDSPEDVAARVEMRRNAGLKVLLLVGIGDQFSAANAWNILAIVDELDRGDLVGVELGNETSAIGGTATSIALAKAYARLVRAVGSGAAGTGSQPWMAGLKWRGIPLFAQGDRFGREDPHWLWEMYKEDAANGLNLHFYVDAWVLHPYGPPKYSPFREGYDPNAPLTGLDKRRLYDTVWNMEYDLAELRKGATGPSAAGFASPNGPAWAAIPRAVTEFGVASRDGDVVTALNGKNYTWEEDLTYAQAGLALKEGVSCLLDFYGGRTASSANRLWNITVFHARDQAASSTLREQSFGAFRNDGETEKPGYTGAVRDLLTFPTSTCPTGGMEQIPQ